MKNAMKKLMSLVLVAVMLLSAVPFQAGAEEITFKATFVVKDTDGNELFRSEDFDENGYYDVETYLSYWVDPNWSVSYTVEKIKVNGAEVGTSYTVTETDVVDGKLSLGVFLAPISNEPEVVDYCDVCEGVQDVACTPCADCGAHDHAAGSTDCPNYVAPCTSCGQTGHEAGSTACPNYDYCAKCEGQQDANHAHCADCDSPNHAAGSTDCPLYEAPVTTYTVTFVGVNGALVGTEEVKNGKVTAPAAPFVNGYDFQGWLYNGKYYDADDDIKVGNANITISAVYKNTDPVQYYTINVYARKYVGGSLKETQLIHKNEKMRKGDNVLDYLKSVEGDLRTQVYSRFSGCDWTGHFYNYYGQQVATDNVTTTNGAKNIYINVYSQHESDVLVYVHTTSTSTYDSLIEMTGYEKDETIPYAAVLAAVKEKYYGSNLSMTMYDEDGWADYKAGKSNTSTKGVEVKTDGSTTKIHVILKNAAAYSSSANADSSNPKTGDTIYMAVTAMAVSASALLLFVFMNKKRVIK